MSNIDISINITYRKKRKKKGGDFVSTSNITNCFRKYRITYYKTIIFFEYYIRWLCIFTALVFDEKTMVQFPKTISPALFHCNSKPPFDVSLLKETRSSREICHLSCYQQF